MSAGDTEMNDTAKAVDDGLDRKTLFVRSIPFEATSDELSEFFSQFAPVKHAVIVTDGEKNSRGFGFVSFTLEDDTISALAESKKAKFKNRYLRVDVAKRRERKDRRDPADRVTERTTERSTDREPVEKRRARLIIRNMPWSCKDPQELKKIFSKYGAVFDAYIPRKKGGRMCGFAFVTMMKKAAAEKAVSGSTDLKIDGREVAVDLAIQKSHWEKAQKEETDQEDEAENIDDSESDSGEPGEEDTSDMLSESKIESSEASESGSDSEESSDEQDEEFQDLNDLSKREVDNEHDVDAEKEAQQHKPKANRQEPFSVFVRNIPYDADAETLKEHFEKMGPVKYALPVIDKATGIARGTAFVAFKDEDSYTKCLENSPSLETSTMLIADDVSSDYVYQGRILTVTPAVDRSSASKLAERNSNKRMETLGKAPGEKDKRNLFLLNEGRITERSKLAQFISKSDLELREKSYKLRTQQLSKNPSLFISLTRLAVRNLPRAMNSKALKALGRKGVVQFATEVKDNIRQPLSKEEFERSTKFKNELKENEEVDAKKSKKHAGVVKQAKVIYEVKGSGEAGRSRGYGFIEFRDHRSALMGLRWLNAHAVTNEEILEGLNEEEQKNADLEGLSKRKLIVEFAIENVQVVKRRQDRVSGARDRKEKPKRKRDEDSEESSNKRSKNSSKSNSKDSAEETKDKKPVISDDVKKIIGSKRKKRKGKK